MFLALKSAHFVSENSTPAISELFIGVSDTGHTQCGRGDINLKDQIIWKNFILFILIPQSLDILQSPSLFEFELSRALPDGT